MKLCCGLMDGQLWDATLQTSPEGDSEGGPVVVLSNDEILSPQDADFGEFSIADATEEERRNLERAGYHMPDWDPMQWSGCGGCQADHTDMKEQPGGPGEFKPPA
jgi:hypothetical protein